MEKAFAMLIPKKSLTSDQLKEFGAAIMDWIDAEQAAGIGAQADSGPINDMLAGELPKPLALNDVELLGINLSDLRKRLGAGASTRAVRLCAFPLPQGGMSEDEFLHRLTLHVPSDYIERVTVDETRYVL